jgi:predicted dehydrogenase
MEEKSDIAFVCTSPGHHADIIFQIVDAGINVFTELNLVSNDYDRIIEIAEQKKVIVFMSSTMLYNKQIQKIDELVNSTNKPVTYVYHIGQYLPDWHPWESYKDFFLGDKRTNGCREILAIELPWLTNAFGEIKDIHSNGSKITNLDIDYCDNFVISLEHENGNKGSLVVDVVSPVGVRKFETYTEGKYISWSGTPESLQEFNEIDQNLKRINLSEETEHVDGYNAFIVENAYRNEIKAFFDMIIKGVEPVYGFEQDKKILKIIERIGA